MPIDPKALHIDAILTNMSVKYRNEEMIWPLVMPMVKVGKRSDKYWKYAKEDTFRIYDDKVGPISRPNEATWSTTTDNYSVKDHALADWLPQEAIDNADNPLDPEIDTNEFLNMILDNAQEQRVSAIVFALATYPAANRTTLSGTAQWGQSADFPIQDVLTALEVPFMRPNTLIFGSDTWKVFRALPEVLDAVKGATRQQATPGGLASTTEIAGLLEVDRVLIGRGRFISTKEGQTATYGRLWGKHMAALYVDPNPGIRTITFGVTFAEMLRETQRDFDPKLGVKGAHYFKVAWNSDEKVVASDVGYFIENAVA